MYAIISTPMEVRLCIVLACWSKILCLHIQNIDNAPKGRMEAKIVGGVEVPISMYPYVASLVLITTSLFCGGTIISGRVILTAAHCFSLRTDEGVLSLGPEHFEVALGATKWRDGVRYRVCKTLSHPSYEANGYKNDLGLVLLAQIIKYGPTVQKVSIANGEKWRNPKYTFEIAGFGIKSKSGIGFSLSSRLQATRMRFVPRDICNVSYSDLGDLFVPESMFCMLGKGGTSDCFGDSGSAILWKARFVVGTVATGRETTCGSHTVPSMYTDAVYFRNWIYTNVERLEKENDVKHCLRHKHVDSSKLFKSCVNGVSRRFL